MRPLRGHPSARGLWTLLLAALLLGSTPVIGDDGDGDGKGGICIGGLNLPSRACVPPDEGT
jgi:hypothetical protein